MSELFINGTYSSKLFGVRIETPPRIVSAVRKASVLDIPGSSQPLVRDLGGAEMIQRVYDVFIDPSRAILNSLSSAEYQTRQFLGLLSSYGVTGTGFFKLSDSYIRDLGGENYYFKARLAGGEEFENVFARRGRGQLVFDCVPRMYLDAASGSDEEKTVLENVGTTLVTKRMPYVDPIGISPASGDPRIEITFSASVNYLNLTVDGIEMRINLTKHGAGEEKLIIDSELKNCWYESAGGSLYKGNGDVTLNTDYKFPTITTYGPTITAQTTSGTVDEIAVYGRWYRII